MAGEEVRRWDWVDDAIYQEVVQVQRRLTSEPSMTASGRAECMAAYATMRAGRMRSEATDELREAVDRVMGQAVIKTS